MLIGITERGDAGLDKGWLEKVKAGTVDGCIAISKAPAELLYIDIPDNVVVHCTITDLPGWMEPKVPNTGYAVNSYQQLVEKLGEERVVLRVDPVVPLPKQIEAASYLIAKACSRVRVSFFDYYGHVRQRMLNYKGNFAGDHIADCQEMMHKLDLNYRGELHAPLSMRKEALADLQMVTDRKIEVCGEPGMECTGCVSARDIVAMGLKVPDVTSIGKQRYACQCLAVKQELLNNKKPCHHNCIYCYWKG